MAKITFDQAKAELILLDESIKIYKAAGAPVLKMVQDRFDYLMKVISGNASAQVSDLFNNSIASVINAEGNEALCADICKAVGTKVKLSVIITDGKVSFEAAGSASGGSSAGTGGTGIVRNSSEYNHWKITRNSDGTVQEFDSASGAVKFILNGGDNPMNLPKEFGAGNSMVRVLTTYLPKYETFKASFTVEGSNVAPTPKVKETTPEIDTTVKG